MNESEANECLGALLELSMNMMEFCKRQGIVPIGCASPTVVQVRASMIVAHVSPDGVTIKELARLLQLSQGATSKLVDRLVHIGIVDRVQDSSDRRAVKVFLSEKGRNFSEFHCIQARHLVDKYLPEVSEKDKETFLKCAETLNRRIWEEQLAWALP